MASIVNLVSPTLDAWCIACKKKTIAHVMLLFPVPPVVRLLPASWRRAPRCCVPLFRFGALRATLSLLILSRVHASISWVQASCVPYGGQALLGPQTLMRYIIFMSVHRQGLGKWTRQTGTGFGAERVQVVELRVPSLLKNFTGALPAPAAEGRVTCIWPCVPPDKPRTFIADKLSA